MFSTRSVFPPEGPDAKEQPIMNESPRQAGFVLWLAWVVANAVGFGALAIADWATGEDVSRLLPGTLRATSGNTAAQVATLAVIGASVGLMQALILRQRFSRSALWALATMAAVTVALAMRTEGLPMGTVVGIAQGFILRGRVPQRILWMLANIVGYATGFDAGATAGFTWGMRYGLNTGVMVGFTIGGAMVGAVTGLMLLWLLRPPSERPALDTSRLWFIGLGFLRCWPFLFASILAWIIAEGVVLPLTQVEAPNEQTIVLIASGLVLLLALATFIADIAAVLIAPAPVTDLRHLPRLMLALASLAVVISLPFQLLHFPLSCIFRTHLSVSSLCRPFEPHWFTALLILDPVAPLALIASVYLTLRLALVPPAVVLGGAGVRTAFRVSWRLTGEQWGNLALLGAPAAVLWSAATFVPASWPMPWVSIVHGVLGGVALAWLAAVLALAYIRLGGIIQPGPEGLTRHTHRTVIVGMLAFTVAGAFLDIGRHDLILSVHNRIAFLSSTPGQIYVMNADGSNVTPLPRRLPGSLGELRFSPDGRRIAFLVSNRDRTQVAITNADGSGDIRLTAVPGTGEALDFVLGGSKLGLVSFTALSPLPGEKRRTRSVYLIDTDGSRVTHLADLSPTFTSPRLSPDGRKVAFTVWRTPASGGGIYLVNIDGSRVVRLVEDGTEPAFSPDGTRIAFVSHENIYVMAADGSKPHRLTNLSGRALSVGFSGVSPAFSPDGRKIVFTCTGDGDREIYYQQICVMNINESNVTRLTDAREDLRYPAVGP